MPRNAGRILARLKGWGAAFEPVDSDRNLNGSGLGRAIGKAMSHAGVSAKDLGHVKAHGLSTVRDDAVEARVLNDLLPQTPVTALKGQLGNAGSGRGDGVDRRRSCRRVGLRARGAKLPTARPGVPRACGPRRAAAARGDALCLTWMPFGQSAAVVIGK